MARPLGVILRCKFCASSAERTWLICWDSLCKNKDNQQGSWYNESVLITQRQKDIIIGSILGDGHLDKSPESETRLQLKQSSEKKEYIFWLYEELRGLCRSSPKQRKDNKQWYFASRYLPELTQLRKSFYPSGRKTVPKNIADFLKNTISLAVWFMDDGTLDWREKDHYAFRVTTNCFSIEENELLVKALRDNFAIEATAQTTLIRGKRYPRIHIGADGRDRFLKLIQPFVLDCFRHKLPPIILNPSETRSETLRIG